MLMAQNPASVFTPTHHVLSLLVFALVVVVLVIAGRRNELLTRRVFAAACLGAWLLSSIFYVMPANIEPHMSLPIQACDVLALLAAVTLVLPSRVLRSVMYFGGFGLTSQAFITPTSDIGGPDNIKFWIFWLLHGAILATSIYVVAVNRFRPTRKDLFNASLCTGIYAVAMVALNYGTYRAGLNQGNGWYYGYLGPTLPDVVSGTLLTRLGPWPIRPLMIMLLGLCIYLALWLPWAVARKLSENKALGGDSPDA